MVRRCSGGCLPGMLGHCCRFSISPLQQRQFDMQYKNLKKSIRVLYVHVYVHVDEVDIPKLMHEFSLNGLELLI